MRFVPQISEDEVLAALRELGYESNLPSLVEFLSERYEALDDHARSMMRNQLTRRLTVLVKYRFVRRTGQKGHYIYTLEEE